MQFIVWNGNLPLSPLAVAAAVAVARGKLIRFATFKRIATNFKQQQKQQQQRCCTGTRENRFCNGDTENIQRAHNIRFDSILLASVEGFVKSSVRNSKKEKWVR